MRPDKTAEPHNKDVTKERILEAATEAFAEQGYHGASMDDIVRRSGTSKGSIYFHFPGKEAIFFALVSRLADEMEASMRRSIAHERGAVARVDAALRTLLGMISRHRRLAKVVLAGGVGLGPSLDKHLMALHDRFARVVKRYLDEAVAEGSIPPIDTELTAYVWLGGINEIVVRWLHKNQPDSLESEVPHLTAMLLRTIGIQSPAAGDQRLAISGAMPGGHAIASKQKT